MLIWSYEEKLGSNYSDYIEYLLQRENHEIERFKKYLSTQNNEEKLLDDQLIIESINSLKQDKLAKRTKKYLAGQKASLSGIINQRPNNKRIHETRTILKQIYYLYDIMTDILGIDKLLNLDKERLREIEQYLGSWHDLVNSPKYLNMWFRTKNTVKSEKYLDLKKQIQEDTNSMRIEIIQNIFPEINS